MEISEKELVELYEFYNKYKIDSNEQDFKYEEAFIKYQLINAGEINLEYGNFYAIKNVFYDVDNNAKFLDRYFIYGYVANSDGSKQKFVNLAVLKPEYIEQFQEYINSRKLQVEQKQKNIQRFCEFYSKHGISIEFNTGDQFTSRHNVDMYEHIKKMFNAAIEFNLIDSKYTIHNFYFIQHRSIVEIKDYLDLLDEFFYYKFYTNEEGEIDKTFIQLMAVKLEYIEDLKKYIKTLQAKNKKIRKQEQVEIKKHYEQVPKIEDIEDKDNFDLFWLTIEKINSDNAHLIPQPFDLAFTEKLLEKYWVREDENYTDKVKLYIATYKNIINQIRDSEYYYHTQNPISFTASKSEFVNYSEIGKIYNFDVTKETDTILKFTVKYKIFELLVSKYAESSACVLDIDDFGEDVINAENISKIVENGCIDTTSISYFIKQCVPDKYDSYLNFKKQWEMFKVYTNPIDLNQMRAYTKDIQKALKSSEGILAMFINANIQPSKNDLEALRDVFISNDCSDTTWYRSIAYVLLNPNYEWNPVSRLWVNLMVKGFDNFLIEVLSFYNLSDSCIVKDKQLNPLSIIDAKMKYDFKFKTTQECKTLVKNKMYVSIDYIDDMEDLSEVTYIKDERGRFIKKK